MTLNEIKGRCRIEDGHWIWTGAKCEGVPRIWAPDYTSKGGRMVAQTGRRAVWHVKTGAPIPAGHRVFGTCTEPCCLHPLHMACRPVSEQGAMVAASGKLKGRVTRIAANRAIGRKRSMVTPEQIAIIQSSSKTGIQLAQELGLTRQIVSKHRSGRVTAFDPVGGMFSGLLIASQYRQGAQP